MHATDNGAQYVRFEQVTQFLEPTVADVSRGRDSRLTLRKKPMSPDHMIAIVSAGLIQTAPPSPPPKPPLVHGYVYFEPGSATPIRRYQVDPIEYLGPRIPTDSFVYVRGQTDTVGSGASNQALSRKRAFAVADLLVLEGVDPQRITVMSCGERILNRPTADDMPDPLNRFVLFDWYSEPHRAWALCPSEPYRR